MTVTYDHQNNFIVQATGAFPQVGHPKMCFTQVGSGLT